MNEWKTKKMKKRSCVALSFSKNTKNNFVCTFHQPQGYPVLVKHIHIETRQWWMGIAQTMFMEQMTRIQRKTVMKKTHTTQLFWTQR